MRAGWPALLLLVVSLGALRITISGMQAISRGADARAAVTRILEAARDLETKGDPGMTMEEVAHSIGGELCRPAGPEGPDRAAVVVVRLSAGGPHTYGIIRFADRAVIGIRVMHGERSAVCTRAPAR